MVLLIIGLWLFIGAHLFPTMTNLRGVVYRGLGPVVYRGLFSVIALSGFVLVVWGYAQARETGSPILYNPPAFLNHVTHLLMVPVFILLVSSYAHGRITRIVRHPMVTAIKFWALAHLLSNGDQASVILFGSFLAWAVISRVSLATREQLGLVEVKDGPVRNDIIAVIVGVVLYLAFLAKAHTWLIGVPAL